MGSVNEEKLRCSSDYAGAVEKKHESKKIKFWSKSDGRVFLHPSSVNFSTTLYESPFVAFKEKVGFI